ncbi:MAG: hypothetical protein K1X74_07760 [Pirellulales bacterium]|nr:hypothetical protein [Pirellulales bacterium]
MPAPLAALSWRGMFALAAFALAARLTVVWLLADAAHPPYTFEHGQIAANLLAGKGFAIRFLGSEGPTSQQAPCYPLLLAAVQTFCGQGLASLYLMQVLQALAGAACVVLVAQLAARWFPESPAAGWFAGLLAAVHPTQLYAVAQIQPVVWITLCLFVVLWLAQRAGTSGWRGPLWFGAAAGWLLLWEPILAVALPIAALARLLADRGQGLSWTAGLKRLALTVATAALVIAPWLARNYAVHGELVFIKSTFGYAFWQGNNPLSLGTDKLPTEASRAATAQREDSLAARAGAVQSARLATRYIDDVALTPADYRQLALLGEPQRCRWLGQRAVDFIRTQPDRYARLCLARLRYFLLFDETNPRTANAVFRVTTVAWLVLGTTGLLATWSRIRVLWPSVVIFLAVTAFHALTISSVRFRLPIEPLAWIWAAGALAPLAAHLRVARRDSATALPAPLPEGATLSGPHATLRGPHRAAQEHAARQGASTRREL